MVMHNLKDSTNQNMPSLPSGSAEARDGQPDAFASLAHASARRGAKHSFSRPLAQSRYLIQPRRPFKAHSLTSAFDQTGHRAHPERCK
jgi:hypothetical protein